MLFNLSNWFKFDPLIFNVKLKWWEKHIYMHIATKILWYFDTILNSLLKVADMNKENYEKNKSFFASDVIISPNDKKKYEL